MPYVGIFGGTFDPIHLGHLAAAEGACHLAGLDRVIFMPNRQPPHKVGRIVTSADHRAAMVRLAIEGNPRFTFSDMELEREGPSYTVETIRTFRSLYPAVRIALLLGMDSLVEIHTWHQYEQVLTQTDTIVFTRPGVSVERRDGALRALGPELTQRVRLLEIPGVDLSATLLRNMTTGGYPLRYLVPEAVRTYIEQNNLYAAQ